MAQGGIFEQDDKFNYDTIALIETNIDDMNPESYGVLIDKLYLNSALEVYITPTIMKKSRPAQILSVLCEIDNKDKLIELILRETPSIGIRENTINRTKLKRKIVSVNTLYGDVRIKLGYIGDRLVKAKPEYDDCYNISIKYNIPYDSIVKISLDELEKIIKNS
jgi:hypothetical protein